MSDTQKYTERPCPLCGETVKNLPSHLRNQCEVNT